MTCATTCCTRSALEGFVRAAGGTMRHVKPHGSLFAMCGRREEYARALLDAVASFDPDLIVNVGHGWPRRLAEEDVEVVGLAAAIEASGTSTGDVMGDRL